MRASRLVTLLLLLQNRGRLTADQLAVELEVSVRTVLRDVEALSGAGVPVYAVHGPGGGFELLEGYRSELADPTTWSPAPRTPGKVSRATVRISTEARRIAAVLNVLQPLRVRHNLDADEDGWLEATFRMGTLDATMRDVLVLGGDIEVLAPAVLRERVAAATRAAALHYV